MSVSDTHLPDIYVGSYFAQTGCSNYLRVPISTTHTIKDAGEQESINYDFTFDDAMGKIGCDVFSFDPSMNVSSHKRNSNVTFYRVGLGAQDSDQYEPRLNKYVKRKTFWRMRTLATILDDLSHTHKTIDILKIDVESSEWLAVRNMLDTGALRRVKQILVEWHIFPKYPARETFQQLLDVIRDLTRAGFQSFHRYPHPSNLRWDRFNLQSDTAYVNTNWLS